MAYTPMGDPQPGETYASVPSPPFWAGGTYLPSTLLLVGPEGSWLTQVPLHCQGCQWCPEGISTPAQAKVPGTLGDAGGHAGALSSPQGFIMGPALKT